MDHEIAGRIDFKRVSRADQNRRRFLRDKGGTLDSMARLQIGAVVDVEFHPAVIEEHAATTILHPGDALEVDGFGNLLITVGDGG